MKWLVGLDLARSSSGAIRFAQWAHGQQGDEVMGLHAMEVPPVAAPEWTDAVGEKIRELLQGFVGELGAEGMFIDVAESNDAVQALAEAQARTQQDGIVIGRRAKTEERALIRLGRTARHAIRGLQCPVIVCPPELDMARLDGPILLAADGTQRTGEKAVQFASKLAGVWGRQWVACLVADYVDEYAATYYLKPESLADAQKRLHDSGERLLNAWLGKLSEKPAESVLRQGERVTTLVKEAQDRKACLLVVGARRLSGMDRLFSSSVGMALAAHAGCPVAIVPPAE